MAVRLWGVGSAPALVDSVVHSVVVVFVEPGGVERQLPLAAAMDIAFEAALPVRSFASYRGRRSFPGLWWSATTGEHVGYESWLERDQLMALDADPRVVGLSSQPMWLHWRTLDGRAVRHAPDFFARLDDGTAVVIDVRADEQVRPKDAVVFAATARVCAAVGWVYRRVGGLEPLVAANLRWLAGYRHPRCWHPARAAELLEVFSQPVALLDGAAAVGDPVAVLPVLFHLLWQRRLLAELATARLGPGSLVRAAPRRPG